MRKQTPGCCLTPNKGVSIKYFKLKPMESEGAEPRRN